MPVMSSLASVYFACSVAGAAFFGETNFFVLHFTVFTPVHVPGAYVVLAFTALYLLYVAFDHSQV
jgi:hypothetical protein